MTAELAAMDHTFFGYELSAKERRRLTWIVVLLLAFVSTLPFMMVSTPYTPSNTATAADTLSTQMGHDALFHLMRIESIATGLKQGLFPVDLYQTQAYGFGYPTGICYPDLFMYFPAALRVVGLPLQAAYAIFVFALNLGTAAIALFSFGRMFRSYSRGMACTVLWTLAPYRLCDVLVRSSVGETQSLMFGPLLVLGIWAVFHSDSEETRLGWVWLGGAAAGIVHSHVLSVLLYGIFGFPILIYALVRGRRRDQFVMVLKAAALALVLSLSFIVPFLSYYSQHSLQVQTYAPGAYNDAVEPAQLFSPFLAFKNMSAWVGDPIGKDMPLGVGWALLSALPCTILMLAVPSLWQDRPENKGYRRLLRVSAVLCLVALALTTYLFPWFTRWDNNPIGFIAAKLSIIQFPWRFLGQATLLLVLLWGVILMQDRQRLIKGAALLAVAFAVLEGGFAVSSFLQEASVYVYGGPESIDEAVGMGEYFPTDIDKSLLSEGLDAQPVPSSDAVRPSEFTRINAQAASVSVENGAQSEASVLMPLFWHEQYVLSGGEGAFISNDGGYLRLTVPPQSSASYTISFVEPLVWRVAEAVSAAGAVALVVYLVRTRRR
ncbi:MAG: hypothetical protein Q4B54_05835 [Coriobacteriales bacterium]|nr:hypothetical protein [Coriobacteriales bacterium]